MSRAVGVAAMVVLLMAGAVVVLRSDDGGRPDHVAAGPVTAEYEADGLVLEDATHGPELCLGGIRASDPPQCDGIRLVGWTWDAVADEQRHAGTTWASAQVRGRYDGARFTLTAPPGPVTTTVEPPRMPDLSPACTQPEVVDPSHGVGEWEEVAQGLRRLVPELVAGWVSNEPFVGSLVVRPGATERTRRTVRRSYGGPLCLVERDQRTAAELQAIHHDLLRRFGDEVLLSSADERRGVVELTLVVVTPGLQRALDDEYGEGVVELRGRLRPVGADPPRRP